MNNLRVQLKAGQILFNEGDAPTTAFLIERGELDVSIVLDGRPVILSRLRDGDLVGEMAVLDGGPRSATATAITDCVLFPIDRDRISERLAKVDPIVRALLDSQLKRYRGALRAIRGLERREHERARSSSEISGAGKIRLETHLREALAGEGLDVRYQPIMHIASGRVAGYEALIRWHDKERGVISPMQLIALAEESGLIVEIGEYVFETACHAVQRMIAAGIDPAPFVAVNVSARQLEHPGLIEGIVARVRAARVPPGSLKLEITESQALDPPQVVSAIELCHQHGISVALDDFGTGHAHLTHMHLLAFDTLKLDQGFSRSMLTNPRSMAVVRAIVSMAQAMQADIVAEGVESQEMLDALHELGCEYAQGYLIGKPQTLREIIGAVAVSR